ncbi:MAG: hypothetical protein J7L39_00535, partial [Candidatus Aenigmarchaeota archaeon]|nr:hypothetical protein [Candidatus Aenigmarchaeota archaeon]
MCIQYKRISALVIVLLSAFFLLFQIMFQMTMGEEYLDCDTPCNLKSDCSASFEVNGVCYYDVYCHPCGTSDSCGDCDSYSGWCAYNNKDDNPPSCSNDCASTYEYLLLLNGKPKCGGEGWFCSYSTVYTCRDESECSKESCNGNTFICYNDKWYDVTGITDEDNSEALCECNGHKWIGNAAKVSRLSGGFAKYRCCGDDSDDYWIAYDINDNLLGVCCG